jgi:hypothetical protein
MVRLDLWKQDINSSTEILVLGEGGPGPISESEIVKSSIFTGTTTKELLAKIEQKEMEPVQMNVKLRRERLKSSSKAMRELKGDAVYEEALTWELEKTLKAQEAHTKEKIGS